jgi:uncharacterized protein
MKSGGYLITNDIGQYAFLTEEEFLLFLSWKIDGEKKQELKEKHFFTSDDYSDEMSAAYNRKNQFLAYGPTLHMIVTTLRCNHKCKYCHAAVAPMTAKNLDMTKETAEKVVDTIFYTSAPRLTIEFQWGESLVNWEIVQFIVEYARYKANALQKQLSFALVTNLSLMDEEKLTWLLDQGVSICTSLDGDKLTHNDQRVWKEGDSYEKVTHWIDRINTEMKKRGAWESYATGALTTWTKKSIKNYKKIIDAYVSLGLRTIGFRWLNPYGFAAVEREEMAFTKEEFLEFYKAGMDYILEINRNGYHLAEMISTVYLSRIFSSTDANFMDIRSPSGVAIWGVAYNYDGKVYASDESRMLGRMGMDDFLLTPMLETGEETYKAMANSSVTKIAVQASTVDGIPGYESHVYKPYLGTDVLYNYTQYGNPYSNFSKDEKNQMQVVMLDYLFEKLRDPENEKIFRSWLER